MPCVASRAIADRSVVIRFAHVVALVASPGNRGRTLSVNERVRGPLHGRRGKLLRGRDLFRREIPSSADRGPSRGGMTTLEELVVMGLVALGAIAGGRKARTADAVLTVSCLFSRRSMTVEAGDAFAGVSAHLKLVNDG